MTADWYGQNLYEASSGAAPSTIASTKLPPPLPMAVKTRLHGYALSYEHTIMTAIECSSCDNPYGMTWSR